MILNPTSDLRAAFSGDMRPNLVNMLDDVGISPEKASDQVIVKSQGDFEQLLIVRIDEYFEFTGKLIDRDNLTDGGGKFLRARMQDAGGTHTNYFFNSLIGPQTEALSEVPCRARAHPSAGLHNDARADVSTTSRCSTIPSGAKALPATLRRSSSNDAIPNGSRVSRKPGAIQTAVAATAKLAGS